jgi:hypothetical protein
MVTLPQVIEAIKPRINRVLLFAQASLPEHQFQAFRKLVLDEFGNSGLNIDLTQLFEQKPLQDRQGTGRKQSCKKGG